MPIMRVSGVIRRRVALLRISWLSVGLLRMPLGRIGRLRILRRLCRWLLHLLRPRQLCGCRTGLRTPGGRRIVIVCSKLRVRRVHTCGRATTGRGIIPRQAMVDRRCRPCGATGLRARPVLIAIRSCHYAYPSALPQVHGTIGKRPIYVQKTTFKLPVHPDAHLTRANVQRPDVRLGIDGISVGENTFA